MEKEGYVKYRRISDKDKQGEGYSLAAQQELLTRYAEKQNWKFLNDYEDMQTAKCPGRESFKEMVAFLRKCKKPVHLLVEKTDRLVRNLKDDVTIDELMQLGVVVHYVKEGEILSRESTSHTKFMHGIKVLMAKNYIDNLSEEVKKGKLQKAKEGGWSGPAPYGYRNNKETKGIDPNPETAPMVFRAFELYSKGYSIQATIERLHEEGYRYRSYAAKINKTKLREILISRLYMGEIEHKGEVYQGKHTPLVERSLWYQVQVLLKKGNKPMEMNKKDFLFKGLLYCDECGRPLLGEYKKQGKYVYYRCSDLRKTCTQGYVAETKLIQAINQELETLPLSAEEKADIRQAIRDFGELKDQTAEDEIERIERERKRLLKNRRIAYQDRMDGVIDAEMYQEVEADYNQKMNKLEEQLARLRRVEDDHYQLVDMLTELPEMMALTWIHGNFQEKKSFLNSMISNLKIKNGNPRVEMVSVMVHLRALRTRTEWRGGRGSNPRHPA